MAKADLHAAKIRYDDLVACALRAEREGRFTEAIDYATASWNHVDDMMAYEARYEKQEFKSVPCIDMVLRLAPIIFHRKALDELGNLLKREKAIDRRASDDLAARLKDAVELMWRAHCLWNIIESRPGVSETELGAVQGGEPGELKAILKQWCRMGLVLGAHAGNAISFALATRLNEQVHLTCPECGGITVDFKRSCFSSDRCSVCQSVSVKVICSAVQPYGV
jgi:hypothetical protein